MKNNERQKHLNSIRKKLSLFIKQNKQLNLRDLSRKLDGKIIKEFPRLEKFLDDIASLSSIESYLSERPELIDVSIEPKLVINGKAHPTGTVKT